MYFIVCEYVNRLQQAAGSVEVLLSVRGKGASEQHVINTFACQLSLQLNALKRSCSGSAVKLTCKLSSADLTLSVGNDVIQQVTVVRDLGVYLDNELTILLIKFMHQLLAVLLHASLCFFNYIKNRIQNNVYIFSTLDLLNLGSRLPYIVKRDVCL